MPGAWVLDLSRLTARAGTRQLTGVDRVELAWCIHLLTQNEPVFGLVRTWAGFLLLDRCGLQAISKHAHSRKGSVLPALRNVAIARSTRIGLARMLRRKLPTGVVYLNLAHSNARPEVFAAFSNVRDARSFVFVHDVIPLDNPDTQSRKSGERMQNVLTSCAIADGVISSSHATMAAIKAHLTDVDDQDSIVAPLGPCLPKVHMDAPGGQPYFVVLGTIEPRKAHDLLFDVWENMLLDPPEGEMPHLKVVGARGWASRELFDRLEKLKESGFVSEISENDDAKVAKILAGSHGLLFPSLAEGYGLPALEATVQGIVPICAQLPVFREILGDIPVYVKSRDPYSWRTTILHVMDKEIQKAEQAKINALVKNGNLPTWEDHFNTVLTAIG